MGSKPYAKKYLIILVDKTTKNMDEPKVPETLEEAKALLEAERENAKTFKERAIGAEKAIENNKKKGDKKPTDNNTPPAVVTDEDINRVIDQRNFDATANDFFSKNPDLVESKEEILALTSKGISFDLAKLEIEKRDPTIVSRRNAAKTNFT